MAVAAVEVDCHFAFVAGGRAVEGPGEADLTSHGVSKTCEGRVVEGVGARSNGIGGVSVIDLEYLGEVVFVFGVRRSVVTHTHIELVVVVSTGRRRKHNVIESHPVGLRRKEANVLNSDLDVAVEPVGAGHSALRTRPG